MIHTQGGKASFVCASPCELLALTLVVVMATCTTRDVLARPFSGAAGQHRSLVVEIIPGERSRVDELMKTCSIL